MLMALVWLSVSAIGCSMVLTQTLGVGYVLVSGIWLARSIVRTPATIVHPVNIFLVSCVYLLLLDTATLREVHSFNPQAVLITDTIIGIYLVSVLTMYHLSGSRSSPLIRLPRSADMMLTGNTYFWVTIAILVAEYLERLYFADFSLRRLVELMLLSKSGSELHVDAPFLRGAGGGWEVFFMPIDSLFLGLTAFADRAWKHGVSRPKKVILIAAILIQLGTIVLGGSKQPLLVAVTLPLVIRAAQHDKSLGRWVAVMVLISFLMAPVMDTMAQVRGLGWSSISDVRNVGWNMVEAGRDDNLHWMVRFVSYLGDDPGVLAYKGPLGFVTGLQTVGWQWLINPIPRVLWPTKPEPWKRLEPGRPWYATESAVGDLLRYGGISFVIVGGLLMGFWLSLLESLYLMPKGDGTAMVYGYLLVATSGMVRSTSPIAAMVPLVTCLIVVTVWRVVGASSASRGDRSASDRQAIAYTG